MAHEFETGFFGSGKPAWHGLGTVIDGQVTSEEAIKLAKLDWEVELETLYRRNPDGTFEPSDSAELVRSTDRSILGKVTTAYKPTQNWEAFAFMDKLLGEGVRYESAGSLKGGKIVWMLAAMPEDIKVAGDDVRPYVFLSAGHDGHHGICAADTHTRVVCWNTLSMATAEAKAANRYYKTRHLGDVDERLKEATEVLEFMKNRGEKMAVQAEKFLNVRFDEKKASGLFLKLWPDSQSLGKIKLARNEETRSRAFRALRGIEDIENFRWTGWGVFNALSDMICHHVPEKKLEDQKKTQAYRERNLMKLTTGHNVLDQAEKLILAMA